MSKPLFSSGIAAKANPEERKVKPLFESAVPPAPPAAPVLPTPAVVSAPVVAAPVPKAPPFAAPETRPVATSPVAEKKVDDFFKTGGSAAGTAPLAFKEAPKRQQPAGAAVFQGVRSFTDQARDEITAVVPSVTFLQMDFLQQLVVDYYKQGFEVWQALFTKIGKDNVEMNDALHQAITTHSDLRIADAIKTGVEYVSGDSGKFFGWGKKSYDEVFGLLRAAEAPKTQIREKLKGLKTRVERLHAQVRFILDVVPNMPSVKESDKVVQYLTPMESSVLMLQAEIQLFEANFERDMSALERLLYTQMPAMRHRT